MSWKYRSSKLYEFILLDPVAMAKELIDSCIAKLNEAKLDFEDKYGLKKETESDENVPPNLQQNAPPMAPPMAPPLPNLIKPQPMIKVKKIEATISNAKSLLKHVTQTPPPIAFDNEVKESVR